MQSLQQCCDITCRLTQWAHFGQLTDLDAGATADACPPCRASWPKFYIQIRIPFNPLCPPPSSWDEATGTNAWKCPFLENNFTPSQEINIMPGKGWDNHQSWGVVWHTAHTQDKIFNPISLQAKNQMLDILCEATVDVFLFRFCCRPAGDLNHPEEWEEDPEKMVSRSVWSFACVLVCFFFACFFFAALHPDQIPSRSVSSFAFVFVCLSLVFLFVVAVFVCLFVACVSHVKSSWRS